MRYTLEKFITGERAILLINIAVIVSLAYVASIWANIFLSQKLTVITQYVPPKITKKPLFKRKAEYSIIKRRNLFNPEGGQIPTELLPGSPSQPVEVDESVPPTSLKLKLIGTVMAAEDINKAAIIEDSKTREQSIFRLHDSVAPGADIVQIERFRIVIDNSGRIETLSINFEDISLKSRRGKSGKRKRKSKSGAASIGSVKMMGEGQVLMDRRYLESQLTNMNDLLVSIRAVPQVNKEGVMDGFMVFQIKKGSIYDKIGLKNKDVIKRINGQALDSAEKGLDLFMALKNETRFEVDFVRNKANKTLTINVQ